MGERGAIRGMGENMEVKQTQLALRAQGLLWERHT